jgi:Holliday junction resolvasome RuvABC ATP-dependent DNA helicase subunit
LPHICFSDDCIKKVATTIRGNARSAVKRAKEIDLYCGAKDISLFDSKHFEDLCDQVGILPLGISHTEKQILEALNTCGSATLTGLAAKIGMSKTALQRDHELYLLHKSLIEIDGKRKITGEGINICKQLNCL